MISNLNFDFIYVNLFIYLFQFLILFPFVNKKIKEVI